MPEPIIQHHTGDRVTQSTLRLPISEPHVEHLSGEVKSVVDGQHPAQPIIERHGRSSTAGASAHSRIP